MKVSITKLVVNNRQQVALLSVLLAATISLEARTPPKNLYRPQKIKVEGTKFTILTKADSSKAIGSKKTKYNNDVKYSAKSINPGSADQIKKGGLYAPPLPTTELLDKSGKVIWKGKFFVGFSKFDLSKDGQYLAKWFGTTNSSLSGISNKMDSHFLSIYKKGEIVRKLKLSDAFSKLPKVNKKGNSLDSYFSSYSINWKSRTVHLVRKMDSKKLTVEF